ncbi:CWF19-like protein 1 [Parasteatoda tepidariorum]|nr:CWF19-like protein 1 [Parasteatoda tepidariorum]
MSELKILVCGDVQGQFKSFFSKVGMIHQKKGPFEYLLCVGNFFGPGDEEWQDVLKGKITVPLTTYILGPNRAEHVKHFPDNSEELASNIIHLGKRGMFTGVSGLRIAYLSGVEHKDSSRYTFNRKDVTEILTYTSQFNIDILLTSQWPRGVSKFAKEPEHIENKDSNLIAYLAKELKPRYHFSALSETFYERLPYRNHKVLQEIPTHVTRFIGLASVNNSKKLKWIYAFNIKPYCSMNSKQLAEISGPVTECPYEDLAEDHINEFFYDTNSKKQKRAFNMGEENKPRKREKFSVTQDNCWFCLGNPSVEKHLLISVADYSYLALPKGGLVEDHLLILPIEHKDAVVNVSEPAYDEIYRFKKVLSKYFYDNGKDVIFFERNLSSAHLQIQVVPVPDSVTSKVKNTILELGAAHGVEFDELPEFSLIKQIVPENKPYIYFEIVRNKKISTKLLCVINKHIPIQFGRMVLASKPILDLPDRIDWKSCALTEEEERNLAEQFRKKFKAYDFSL